MYKRDKLRVQMTPQEQKYYEDLFFLADKEKKGRVQGREAASFLKKSGIPKDMLKELWAIAAQTNMSFLEKEEFFIALRLIALAQTNQTANENAIRTNNPIPPLPRFDIKEININDYLQEEKNTYNNNELEKSVNYEMSNSQSESYSRVFSKIKDSTAALSYKKLMEFCSQCKLNEPTVSKVIELHPFNKTRQFSENEFKVFIHLVNAAHGNPDYVPSEMPRCLRHILQREYEENSNFQIHDERVPNNNRSAASLPPDVSDFVDMHEVKSPEKEKNEIVLRVTKSVSTQSKIPERRKVKSSTTTINQFEGKDNCQKSEEGESRATSKLDDESKESSNKIIERVVYVEKDPIRITIPLDISNLHLHLENLLASKTDELYSNETNTINSIEFAIRESQLNRSYQYDELLDKFKNTEKNEKQNQRKSSENLDKLISYLQSIKENNTQLSDKIAELRKQVSDKNEEKLELSKNSTLLVSEVENKKSKYYFKIRTLRGVIQ